jgi:uncharacterized protein (TIGR03437 family)
VSEPRPLFRVRLWKETRTKVKKCVLLLFLAVGGAFAQSTTGGLVCAPTANPPLVHAEGVAEAVGDIVLTCTGGVPGTVATGNFSIFLNTAITNKLSGNHLSDAVLTIDTGSGPAPSASQPRLVNDYQVSFDGVSFTMPANGQVELRVVNIRANASALANPVNDWIVANLAANGPSQFVIGGSQFVVAKPTPSLYSLTLSKLVCSQAGSPVPSSLTLDALLNAGSTYAAARVTEGYVAAFQPRQTGADSGTRIISHYTGYPSGARVFVPNAIAGSSATEPTSGGDFGTPVSAGQYTPGGNGSLLLIRVTGTDANGAGGTLVWTPSSSKPLPLGIFADVEMTNGDGIAVYEVADANPNAVENAQIPAFLGLAPGGSYYAETGQELRFGPVSDSPTASATAPVPRFVGLSNGNDCNLNGDCDADYLPKLDAHLNTKPLTYVSVQGGVSQTKYLGVRNAGQSVLNWTAQAQYKTGSGWLSVTPAAGVNAGTVRVDAIPGSLAPGTYEASIFIDGGLGGQASFPVSLTINGNPAPTVTEVLHAATYVPSALVPGSFGTIKGNFAGTQRSVTLNGTATKIVYQDDKQINLLVPEGLPETGSAQLVVTVDQRASAPVTVGLAASAPGIFPGGVLNQDSSLNQAGNPAAAGSVLQVFATGLFGPEGGQVQAKVGDQVLSGVEYAGVAPGIPGLQQVNVRVPSDTTAGNVRLQLCNISGAAPACSPAVPVSVR